MYLGKPVIATGYGGVTDFLDDEHRLRGAPPARPRSTRAAGPLPGRRGVGRAGRRARRRADARPRRRAGVRGGADRGGPAAGARALRSGGRRPAFPRPSWNGCARRRPSSRRDRVVAAPQLTSLARTAAGSARPSRDGPCRAGSTAPRARRAVGVVVQGGRTLPRLAQSSRSWRTYGYGSAGREPATRGKGSPVKMLSVRPSM